MIEREKRWILDGEIPHNKVKDKFEIIQTYAHFNPDVRIRKIVKNNIEEFYHTVKYQLKDNTREELEYKINENKYNKIFDSINKIPITKTRYVVELENGLCAEIDEFQDSKEKIIEVEFPTEKSMNEFVIPNWFGKELSKNKSFNVKLFCQINNLNMGLWD